MNKLTRQDIQSNEDYLKERDTRRKEIIALKKLRRIDVGDTLSFTFENRETVKYQIQEMMRVERIDDEKKIQREIDVYNDLIPESGMLSATMFIEIPEALLVKPLLDKFQGLDQKGTVSLKVNQKKSFAEFEPGHSKEDRISAVHYVRFPLTDEQIKDFHNADVEIEVRHPHYIAKALFTKEQIEEIAKDLAN